MKKKNMLVLLLCCLLFPVQALSVFDFQDERFQGVFTTENLDQIIAEYELFDGWYWTTEANIPQNFHGREDCPGWTNTTDRLGYRHFQEGWFGCRWPLDRVMLTSPGKGGYGECFGFAQFIGYLLSGEINPQHRWRFFYSVKASNGLKIGDIVRTEYTWKGKPIQHSAIVYSITDDEILFLQVSGSHYNKISLGGFSDGHMTNLRSESEIARLPWLKISRSPMNIASKDQ